MKTHSYLVLLLSLAMGLTACSSNQVSKENDATVYQNIITAYGELAAIQQDSRIQSDFLWSDDALGTGWSISERTHRWAIGKESTLTFSADTANNYMLHLQCWPPSFKEETQELSLLLNGEALENISISPQEKHYAIELPDSLLVNGKNELGFRFAHTQNPCDYAESDDCRELALAFEKIEFEPTPKQAPPTLRVEESAITQAAGASFSYYAKLPEQTRLDMRLERISKGLDAVVTIRTDADATKEIRLSKKGDQQIDLAEFAGEIVEIHFFAEAGEGSRPAGLELEWSKLELHAPLKDESGVQHTQKAVTELREALKKYKVIYLVLDAFHAKHADLYGYKRETTPFLDTLAEESVVFDHMFANEPYTLASTASLFTSRYSHEHGLVQEINRINPIIPTLSELLAGEEIDSGLISDSGWLKESAWGLLRGFTHTYTTQSYSHDAKRVTAALEDFYSERADQSSFMYIHLIPPHGPYMPPEKFRIFMEAEPDFITPHSQNLAAIDKGKLEVTQKQLDYIIAMYDANILYADRLTKQILDYLEERNLLEQTIVIVSSDHGEAFRQHGRMLHNSTVFDEMLHVPFLIHFPEALNLRGKRVSEPVSLVDVMPTLMEIYGISEQPEVSGRSLLPLLAGEEDPRDYLYAETLYTGDRTVRDARYKYIHSSTRGDMLFEMAKDPEEQHNLLDSLPVTSGYYAQKIRPYLRQNAARQDVEIYTLNEDTLKSLKELGYIK